MPDQRHGGISWTEETWNPVRGCTRVSEGCRNCYAERIAGTRLSTPATLVHPAGPYHGFAEMTPAGPRWTGKVGLIPHMLDRPARWKRPRLIFVNSMSDLFHEDLPTAVIELVVDAMLAAPHHTYQVLTKRPDRMATLLLANRSWFRSNIWWGFSAEDQATFINRYAAVLPTFYYNPSGRLWASLEPLLGEIRLPPEVRDVLRWVVVGGESGPGARIVQPEWVRSLRNHCEANGVPFQPPACRALRN